MKTPEIPPDEQARLNSLLSFNILDTPPEERFDRLTRIARRMFDVPIALVSLIDAKRQWFKSCIGLDAHETSRDISFCGHAILRDEVFIIPDARNDPRFADNPLVTGAPHIRFYAGCPLHAPDGHKLGTLCIIDQKPRNLHKEDLAALQDLAAMVESELAAIQLATVDELTGISNRRGFLLFAQHSLALCARQQLTAALVFLDLDSFKQINDRFGHAEGDRALRDFAELLKGTFRQADCYGRIGGDEFAVLLANTNKAQADIIVARFGTQLFEYNRSNRRGYEVEYSCGIVEYDATTHHDIEAMLKDGDSLMYQRKRAKR